MNMVAFLRKQYPKVHVSLHAGELAPRLVLPYHLTFHIDDAINVAQTDRIGHVVDIAYEKNATQLLDEMAKKHILVEVPLTSNAYILNIYNAHHPFLLYLQHHVPVALCTDDEGILRTDLTREFKRAILSYHLSYSTLKRLVRNS